MRSRRFVAVVVVLLVLPVLVTARPGQERWSTKTSLDVNARHEKDDHLAEIISLHVPDVKESEYQDKRIPTSVSGGDLYEGDLVTVVGWMHLVAFESTATGDDDYHMQMTDSQSSGDACVIIEAPNPDYINDKQLAGQSAAIRQFVDERLLWGKHPSSRGIPLTHPVYVSVTGQPFLDVTHHQASDPGGGRGKRGMHAGTTWELHPLTDIHFAVPPK